MNISDPLINEALCNLRMDASPGIMQPFHEHSAYTFISIPVHQFQSFDEEDAWLAAATMRFGPAIKVIWLSSSFLTLIHNLPDETTKQLYLKLYDPNKNHTVPMFLGRAFINVNKASVSDHILQVLREKGNAVIRYPTETTTSVLHSV